MSQAVADERAVTRPGEMLSRQIHHICQIRFGQILPMHVAQEIDRRLELAHEAAGSRDALKMIGAAQALRQMASGKMRADKK